MTKEQPDQQSEPVPELAQDQGVDEQDTSAASADAKRSSEPKSKAPKKRQSRTGSLLMGGVFVLVALGALGLGVHNYQQIQAQAALDTRLQTLEQSLAVQGQARGELQREVEALLTQERQAWGDALQSVQEDLARTSVRITQLDGHRREDWLLAEVEYLLRLASQRLLVEGDVKSAQVLLVNADQVLQSIDDYSLLKVREALQQDLVRLRALPELDLNGAYLQLAALIGQIEQLPSMPVDPFAAQETALDAVPEMPAEEVSEATDIDSLLTHAEGFALQAWQGFAGLYRINSDRDQPVQVLMTPNEEIYLRQNLRLMLEQAQLALLQGRQPVYDHALEKAQRWVQRHFQRQAVTEAMVAQLQELAALQVNPQLPEIGRGLKALKAHLETLYQESLQPRSGNASEEASE